MTFKITDFTSTRTETEKYAPNRQQSGTVSSQYNSMGIFNGYFKDDKNVENTIDALENSFVDYANKYPNLFDNLKSIDNIFSLDKNANIDYTNLPSDTQKTAKSASYNGFYDAETDSIVIIKPFFADDKNSLAHEIGHSLDYKDVNGNGQVDLDEVKKENFGGFSNSDEYKQAYLKDLKNIEEKKDSKLFNFFNKKQLDKQESKINYATQGVDSSDGINEKDITKNGLMENFAVMVGYNLDDDKGGKELIKKLFPNCYALAEEHLKTA